MTRPSDLKPREDESPGTPPDAYAVGAPLPDMPFSLTPEIVEEYMTAVDADPALYVVDGRQAAAPNVLAVYLLAILYRGYPPTQGIILTDVSWHFRHPIWTDETTEIVGNGRVTERFERRGKHFIRWQGDFTRDDGVALASAFNTMYVPAERFEKR